MKKDEEKILNKEYPEDFEIEELKGKKIKLKVKVTAVKEKQLPPIDDELAQDISDKYKTLEDLKTDIRNKLEEAAHGRLRRNSIGKLLDQIVDHSKIDLPKSMVTLKLDSFWQNFVARSRFPEPQLVQSLESQGKTKESVCEEWRPAVEKSLKTQLLIDKMIEEEKIEATDNDIEEELKILAERSTITLEEVKERYAKNNLIEYLKNEIRERKLFDLLLSESTIKKGDKVNFLDLNRDNQ
ncbi:MAG: hypothetical protein AB1798_17515 [Spirochaetota bacterium]